jgi:hypothetical protein
MDARTYVVFWRKEERGPWVAEGPAALDHAVRLLERYRQLGLRCFAWESASSRRLRRALGMYFEHKAKRARA